MNKLNACLKPGLLLLAFCFLASASGLLHAGAPLKINFQGRLEESGQPAEGAKNFVFKIYDALSAGTLVWTSQAQSVPVTNGVFSVLLETGTPVNLSTAAFAGARYVEITVDGVPLSPRQEMASAPYALLAQSLAPDAVISLSNLEKDPSSASVINTSTNAVDWTQLKNVPAGLADGTDDGGGVTFSTAAIVSGKFSDERVSISTGAFYGGFNAASQLVQLEASGNLPALDGSALINVNSAPMSALTAQVNNVAASTGALTAGLAAVVLSTGPLVNSGNWNTAFGWGNHASAGYAGAAALDSVKASTGTLTVNLAAVVLSTGPLVNSGNWNTAFGWGNHASAGYAGAAALDSVKTSTGTLTVNLASVVLSTGSIAAQVNNVAASTGTLTVSLAAVVLSTGPLVNSGNWNSAFGWGNHASAGYAGTAALDSVKTSTGTLTVNLASVVLSTGSIAAQVNNVAASTGTLTVNLASVVLSTGSIAAQVNNVAASTGTLTVNLASVVLSTGSIAAQVNNVAASTGNLTVNLAAVVLSTGPLVNSGSWNTAFGWGNHASAGYAGAAALDSVKTSTGTLTVNLATVVLSTGSITAQVNNVAASTGTLTVNLAAVILSTGPLSNSGNWNTAYGWGSHAAAGYAALRSTQSFTGLVSFVSTTAFTAMNASVPGVTISSGLVVINGPVGIGTAGPNSTLSVGGSFSLPIKGITFADTPYSITAGDYTILANCTDGNISVILPAAASAPGRVYVVKRTAAVNSISLESAGGLVEGAASQVMNSLQGEVITVQSDGTDWQMLHWYWQ